MKCIQKITDATDIRRVKDNEADKLTALGSYKFIPRAIWKKEVRDKV